MKLTPELNKIKEQLEAGKTNVEIDSERLLLELKGLEEANVILHESLALAKDTCPTCRRPL